jgi:hypothetical protein
MRIGTFNTSKCRGKVQKIGVLYIQSPGPFPKLPKIKIKNKKEQSMTGQESTRRRPATTVAHRVQADTWLVKLYSLFFEIFFPLASTFCACGQLLLVGSNACPPCSNFS